MNYTEHDESMDSLGLDGITASPEGISQEAPALENISPTEDGAECIAPVPEANASEEVTIPVDQTEEGLLDPPEDPPLSDESEQSDEAGPEDTTVEKPKRKRVSRKKVAESSTEAASDSAKESGEEDASSDVSEHLSSQEADMPEHDGDQDMETDAFVLNEEEALSSSPLENADAGDTADTAVEEPEPTVPPKARTARRTASAAKAVNRPKKEFVSKPLENKPTLLSLDLNKLDQELSEEGRNEWNAIYASYRSKSILTGRIMGVDSHSFTVRNRESGQTERRRMLCAVIINYRVKVLIPETEMWYPGQERPPYVLRNMSGAEIDYTILDIDREGGVAIASRRLALTAQRHFFDTIKGGRNIGDRLTCRVLAVGPKRCLVECGGRDMSLSQKDLTYTATPDLRTRYHPGQTLNCVLKEYDRREEQFWVSVKETVDNPFFGALRRHPIGSRRQAVISGKYGGGVFCTLSDETVCLCLYSTRHSDLDFHVGDTVILAIKQFDYDRCLIYGRILSKW